LFIDSPGQIDGGSGLRVRILPNGEFRQFITASTEDEVEVAVLLHNSAYSSADGVSVFVALASYREACWRIIATASAKTYPDYHARLGPALILLKHAGPASLEYTKGSTELFDEQGRTLATDLRDGVVEGGISIPYAVPGGTAYFLKFRARIMAHPAQTVLPSGR
jgi:hypothetical protein